MARPSYSFDAISARYAGFDAYFRSHIRPMAPGLAETPNTGMPLTQRLLIATAVLYLAAAPAALIYFPAETEPFRPWALASGGAVLLGLIFTVIGARDRHPHRMVSANVWAEVHNRIAGFFGLAHVDAPTTRELSDALARAPAPGGARGFRVRLRIAGVIRRGVASASEIDLMEGVYRNRPAAILAIGFQTAAPGLAALLDDRIEGADRDGLDRLAVSSEDAAARGLSLYAETAAMAKRIRDPAFLDGLRERLDAIGAVAGNLAVVDDAARFFLTFSDPWLVAADSPAGAAAVGEALADYDAILRLAEAVQPLFEAGAGAETR